MHPKLEKLFIPIFSIHQAPDSKFLSRLSWHVSLFRIDRQNYLFICPLVGFLNTNEVVPKRKDCLSKGLARKSDFPTA